MRNTPPVSRLLAAIALAAGTACANDQPAAAGDAVRDSAGVAIVENAGPPRDGSAPVMLETILRFGDGNPSDTVYHFSRVGGIVRLANGTIVVANDADVRWFDSTGRYIRTATRKGSGPGEIPSYVTSLVRMAGDTVVATSMTGGGLKHVVLSPSGDHVRDETVDRGKMSALGRLGECTTHVLPDLSLVRCETSDEHIRRGPDPGPGLLRRHDRLARITATLDARHDLRYDIGLEQFGVSDGGRTQFVIHPFHARSLVAGGGTPLRIAIVANPEYAIEVWTADGRLERIIRRIDGRRAPSARERAWADERMKSSRYASADVTARVPTPDSLPAGVRLRVTPAGYVMVQQFAVDSTIYDVFDAQGLYVNRLVLPPRFFLYQADDELLTGTRLDENDVPIVEVLRLSSGAAGAERKQPQAR